MQSRKADKHEMLKSPRIVCSRSDLFQGDRGSAGSLAPPSVGSDAIAEYLSRNPHLFQQTDRLQPTPQDSQVNLSLRPPTFSHSLTSNHAHRLDQAAEADTGFIAQILVHIWAVVVASVVIPSKLQTGPQQIPKCPAFIDQFNLTRTKILKLLYSEAQQLVYTIL